MQPHDTAVLVLLLVVCALYGAVGGRPFRRDRRPLLTGAGAVAFQVAEMIVLAGLVWHAARTREVGFAAVFAVALADHLRQVLACDRQAWDGPRNALTLVEFVLLLALATARGVWWAAGAFLVGVLIHAYMLVAKRQFIDLVCLRAGA